MTPEALVSRMQAQVDALAQALAELNALVRTLTPAQTATPSATPDGKADKPAKATKNARKRTGSAKPNLENPTTIGCQHDGGHAESGALTRKNYAVVLAAARAAGHPWLDGSDKPVKHILHAAGTPRTRENVAAAKAKIFA